MLLLDDLALIDSTKGIAVVSLSELLQNLNACLAVAQYDRAEVIVKKIARSQYDPVGIQEANNSFIRGLLKAVAQGAQGVSVHRIQKWLEVEMPQLELLPNSVTLSLVLRALFLQDNAQFRERMARRYLQMADNKGILDTTLASGDYSDHEFTELCRIRGAVFQEIEVEEAAIVATEKQLEKSASIPEIIPTNQQGMGLSTLTRGIKSLRMPQRFKEKVNEETLVKWQILLESDMIDAELERWQVEHSKMLKMGINPALSKKSMEGTLWHWKNELEIEITKHIQSLRESTNPNAWIKGNGQFLEQIPADKLAAITIMGTLNILNRYGVEPGAPARAVITHIGKSLEHETMGKNKDAPQAKESDPERMVKVTKVLTKPGKDDKPITKKSRLNKAKRRFLKDIQQEWTQSARITIAAFLLSKFINVALYPEENKKKGKVGDDEITKVPAFSHTLIWTNGQRKGMIKVCDSFKNKLVGRPPVYENNATQLPMISKPEPWKEFRGGYLRMPAKLMRMKDVYGLQDVYVHAAIENGHLNEVLTALNVLGQTPWKLNERLLQIMIEVWNTGEPLTNFPPADPVMEYPPEPDATADDATKRKWKFQVHEVNNMKSGYQSNRCFINLQLEIASAFSGYSIYFPHNLDFRGRAYPVPGILNHMGADNVRGLFRFAKGKELGVEGLDWLKVHLANTFGFDKASFEERRQFTTDHMDDIRDSVQNPLNGNRWWMKAEDPWQCLATAMEVLAAVDSPDPTKFVSHLPVHQDGTCNGLQHYAALGGDLIGATQVNLVPGARPADIYSEVAKLVKAEIDKDAAIGHPMALRVQNHITRKVVKQPVMTNVYGVTFIGAVEQVKKRIDEILPPTGHAEHSNRQLSIYIVQNIFKVFGDMFSGATKIQFWLAECAGIIASSVSPEQIDKAQAAMHTDPKKSTKKKPVSPIDLQSAVVWTTPLNLPVVQPYRKQGTRVIKTSLQNLSMKVPSTSVAVSKRKQMQGFPPNFVHSLDATHMMLSAKKCDEIGLSFASVHDSFWTHAGDIPKMNMVLRDAFVEMHSENIISRLLEEFKARYKNFLCVRSIPTQSPLGKRIKILRKKNRGKVGMIKGLPSIHELVLEHERLKLLASEDPAERTRGEEMVTPGSLFAELPSDSLDLLHPIDIQALARQPEEQDRGASLTEQVDSIASQSEEVDMEMADQLDTDITDVGLAVANFSDQTEAIANQIRELENKLDEMECYGDEVDMENTPSPIDVAANTESKVEQEDKPKDQPKKRKPNMLKIWAPTTFPEMPKRGDFDVAMLKKSDYFFS